jgi:hypothetical protein
MRVSPIETPPTVVVTKQLDESDVQDMAAGSNGKFGDPKVPETTGSVFHACPPSVLK